MTKSVEEKAADELDRKSIGKVLEQRKEDGRLLGMDRQQMERIRTVQHQGEENKDCGSHNVRSSEGENSNGTGHSAYLRQSVVCQSEASDPRNNEAEHSGCDSKEKISQRDNSKNDLPAGSPTIGANCEPVEASKPREESDLPSLRQGAPTKILRQIEAKESGVLIGNDLESQYRLARAYCASGLMPKALNTPEKVLVALQICRELNLPAMTSIGKIMVLNGTPSLFGEMPLALVRRSGLLEYFHEEFLKNPEGLVVGARCTTQRKGDIEKIIREFTVEDAKLAKLWNKAGPWVQYPARMMQLRARGWNLKDGYPDVLMGCGVAEFDEHISDVEENQAAKLVERFK